MVLPAHLLLVAVLGLVSVAKGQFGPGFGSQNFDLGLQEHQLEFLKVIVQECQENAGRDGVLAVQRTINDTRECVTHVITNHAGELSSLQSPVTNFDDMYETMCSFLRDVAECVKGATKAMEICMKSNGAQTREASNRRIDVMVNYMCSSEGKEKIEQAIVEFSTSPHKMSCLRSQFGEVFKTCYGIEENESTSMKFFIPYNETTCRTMKEVDECFIEEIRQCDMPKFVEALDDFSRHAYQASPCSASHCFNTFYSLLYLLLALFICRFSDKILY